MVFGLPVEEVLKIGPRYAPLPTDLVCGQFAGLDEARDRSCADPHEVSGVLKLQHCLGWGLHCHSP